MIYNSVLKKNKTGKLAYHNSYHNYLQNNGNGQLLHSKSKIKGTEYMTIAKV